jgi:hypothetical protein
MVSRVNALLAQSEKLQGEIRKLIAKEVKKYLPTLRVHRSQEYDDNNYYAHVRPAELLGVQFDIYELENIEPDVFIDVVNMIKKDKALLAKSDEEICKSLDVDDSDLERLIPLAKQIAIKGQSPARILKMLSELYALGEQYIPMGIIDDV